MKKINLLLLLSLVIMSLSCSKDDSNDNNDSGGSSTNNRVFGGTLDNKSYTAVDGNAFLSTNFESKEVLSVRIANQNFECDDNIFNTLNYVSVDIPTDSREVQKLNVVTIFQGSSFGPSNNLEGQAQIISISETNAEVWVKTKSLAPNTEDSPFTEYDLEGRFTVEICPVNTP